MQGSNNAIQSLGFVGFTFDLVNSIMPDEIALNS